MLFFRDDYSDGACPEILQALTASNHARQLGYGNDEHSRHACAMIKELLGQSARDAMVHLLVGGTQTNRIALTAFLRPIEAVLSADTGHIATHETGAIEASGHKVIEIPTPDGKLTPALLSPAVEEHTNEHMVLPRLVYISNSTELGTVYNKSELTALRGFCDEHGLYLYLDGARLPVALCSKDCDLTLPDVAELCDAFYLGGTKNGGMMGEALVVLNPCLRDNLRYYIKQNGALLAKGRFLGIQFETLLRDNLYMHLATKANNAAKLMAQGATALGYELAYPCQTNTVFLLLDPTLHEELKNHCHYVTFGQIDGKIIARFVASFCTTTEDVDSFISLLKQFSA